MDIIQHLRASKSATEQYYQLEEQLLDNTYGPDKWSIRFLLHHLSDAESVLYERIRRGISYSGQNIEFFRQDLWVTELDYQNKPLNLSQAVYSSCRENNIHFAQQFYESKGHHVLHHSSQGSKTVKDIFDKIAIHNQKHLEHIAMALESQS